MRGECEGESVHERSMKGECGKCEWKSVRGDCEGESVISVRESMHGGV